MPAEVLKWKQRLRVARGYRISIDQVGEMDFVAYTMALKDLAECPIVDITLLGIFGGNSKRKKSISELRNHYRKKGK